MKVIKIAAALILNNSGHALLVRKQHTAYFMQAGGKIEQDETPSAALLRELQEELNLTFSLDQLTYVGHFTAPAANEAGHVVEAEVFSLRYNAEVTPAAEIAEAIWLDPAQIKNVPLAPLTKDFLLPLVHTQFTQ